MDVFILFLVLSLIQAPKFSLSTTSDTLRQGSSLSVEKLNDALVSANGVFSAGFSSVGDNVFCFAISFMKSSPPTIVWMANRDQPVNGIGSKLSLSKDGNLILLDAGRFELWSTKTGSLSVYLQLHDNGNLVLHDKRGDEPLWESFAWPTDTLLPDQKLISDVKLVSSKSRTNYSSGYYWLYFDNDNILRLLYQGPYAQISSVYWPDPWRKPSTTGRIDYNNTKIAMFSSTGHFSSSDNLVFSASDCDVVRHRRLTLDPDGNLRFYSFDEKNRAWFVTWQQISRPCTIHGICGPNGVCTYNHALGRKCSCLPGYKLKNYPDWTYGCEPEFDNFFNKSSDQTDTGFLLLRNFEFYGYDTGFFQNRTLQSCEEMCLTLSECKGFQFKFSVADNFFNCFPKTDLLNGHHTPNFDGDLYLRLPKAIIKKQPVIVQQLDCSNLESNLVLLDRPYEKEGENGSLKYVLWLAVSLGGVEMACISIVLYFLFWNGSMGINKATQGYMLAATARFQKFSYAEMKKATRGFKEEIGRGAGGIVYKGVLSDQRVAAIKRLNEAQGGEAEFLAEISTIGRLNHMNLIEMWGYCAEGKHRLLVYEYMENGSLANMLTSSNAVLDWEKRLGIALGTAKGLAYLHEECMEWVLHCDVKPQNILLDSNYRPKVADFGLSKLQNRGNVPRNSSFSRIRGTRGYMAPEWVYNLPITSKVDVYSYGIVTLEIVTGKKPTEIQAATESSGRMVDQQGRLVTTVKEKMNASESWIEEIADALMGGNYDVGKLQVLIKVALQCVEEDKEARPTMGQVVEMLQGQEHEHP